MNYKLKKLAYHIASWNIKPKYIQGVFINTTLYSKSKKVAEQKRQKNWKSIQILIQKPCFVVVI